MAKAKAKKARKTPAPRSAKRSAGKSRAEDRRGRKLLKRLKSDFLADYRADRKWRREKAEDEDFYDGEMWSEDEKRVLEERGQHPVVINRVKPKIDAISGMQMEMGVDTKAFPRGLRDFKAGHHFSTALRYVEQISDFDTEENDAFEDVLKSGRAWYKTYVEWRNFLPQICTKLVDNDNIVPDRNAKKADHSDARAVSETLEMEAREFNELYPGHENDVEECLADEHMGERSSWGGHHNQRKPDQYKDSPNSEDGEGDSDESIFVNHERKLIRVVIRQEREAYYERVIVVPGQGTIDASQESDADIAQFLAEFPDAQEYKELRFRLNQYLYIWNALVEVKTDIAPWDVDGQLWYTKTPGYRRKKDRVDYGLIRQMKDPNRELNKRRSKLLHEISTVTVIREEGAVEDPEDAREELHKADGDVVVRPGMRFEIKDKTQATQGQLLMLEQSKQELDQTGAPRELEGVSNASSGREYAMKYKSQQSGLRRLFRNLRGSRLRKSKLELKFIKAYWTEEMALKVTDDPEAPPVILNQPVIDPETGAPVMDPFTGEPLKMNDVNQGDFDLIVEESPEYINLESETFAQLSMLASKGFPIPPQLLLSVAPIPDREKWIAKIEQIIATQQAQAAALEAQKQAGANPAQVA